jgi:hypothetical protein
VEPSEAEIERRLRMLGLPGEAEIWVAELSRAGG